MSADHLIRDHAARTTLWPAIAAAMLGALGRMTFAQETYRKPPAEVVKLVEAPAFPGVSIDPSRRVMLLLDRETLPPIADLAAPMLRLAGYRINPDANAPHGPRAFTGMTFKRIADGKETRVALPAGANIGSPVWSPDGSRVAFTITTDTGVELWLADADSGAVKQLIGPSLNTALGRAVFWMPDGKRLLVQVVPEGRGKPPEPPRAPTGPVTQETRGKVAPVRTFQDLLKSPHDEALFTHYATSQLCLLDTSTGARTNLGAPAVFAAVDPAPSGSVILVSRIVKPYSYLVTAGSFPEVVELWDLSGAVVREIAKVPLREEIPIEGVQTGPRGFRWRSSDGPDALFWAEALDGGDPKKKTPQRDKIMLLAAPFRGDAAEVTRTEHRYVGMQSLETGGVMLSEYDRDKRWSRTWLLDADKPAEKPRLVFDRSINDRYNDPGQPVTTTTRAGRSVVLVRDNAVYLTGQGATKDGDLPFLSRMDLATLERKELWRCAEGVYETVIDVLDPAGTKVLTSAESLNDAPNYFIRDVASGARTQVTRFPDPQPELRGVRKELVKYKRADGVDLSAVLYVPANRKEGERLPLIVWAYPQEFNDASTAGQVSGSPWRFTRITGYSHLFLLTQGYAIMDDAAMPVVGEPETANDTFVEQIVGAAKAAIDKAAEMGVADPTRVGVGGHSYGAFMTANLLAHCDLFKAGVARSGAYNRTLTPFGFQAERRTFWEAPQIYMNLSPFTHASKIKTPLLMIHGEIDNNPGTFPMQSERLYAAIKGHGGTARLVMLPFESHGYRAKESVLHTLAEMIDWFDEHVKGKEGTPAAKK